MKKTGIMVLVTVFLLVVASAVLAEEQDFTAAKEWINSKVSCDALTEDQLDLMGDYYMEQIHPGRAHELMDTMMGGEGSESLRWMHVVMAQRLYCQENIGPIGYGPMNYGGMRMMMGGIMGSGMMNIGIMGYRTGMMSGWGYGYWGFLQLLYLLLAIGLVVLVYLWIWKLWKSMKTKSK